MSRRVRAKLIHVIGLLICVIPPALSVIEHFPILSETPKKQVSMFGVLLLAICCVPFWKSIKAFLRSPSAWKAWLVIFLISYLLNAIIAEMVVISSIGLASGIIGCAVFKIERWYVSRGEKKEVSNHV